MAFGTFTLTGHFDAFGGAPAAGYVQIDGLPQVIVDTAGNKIKVGPKRVTLDTLGNFSIALPSNSTTGDSTTIGFRVSAHLKHQPDAGVTEFYAKPIGATVDLATLTSTTVMPVIPTGVSLAELDSRTAGWINDAASATAIAIAIKNGTLIPVTRFGAVADGADASAVANTTAIQQAINSLNFTTANGDAGGAGLYLGSGTFVHTGLSVPRSMKWFGAGKRTTALKLKNGANTDGISVAMDVPMFEMQDMTVDGNKANNTSGRGIVFLGDFATPGVYRGSGVIMNVTIRNCADHGLHAERWRSNGRLINVTSGGNGGDGWRLDGFDWQVSMGDCGNNAASGGRVSMGNLTCVGTQFYGNLNNCYVDTGCDRSIWRGIVAESSTGDNVYVNSTQQSRTHSFDGSFGVPLGATNLFSHFKIDSARVVNISGHVYDSTGATSPTVPKYIVDNTTGSGCQVEVGGLIWQNDDYGTAFAPVLNFVTMGGQGWSRKYTPSEMTVVSGTAAAGNAAAVVPVMSMPNTTNSSIAVVLKDIPRKWKTFDVYVHTVNLGTGTGNFSLRPVMSKHIAGEDVTVATTGIVQTTAAGAQNIRKDVFLLSIEAVLDFTYDMVLRVDRRGADATDTLANAIGVTAVEIRWHA